MVPKHLPYKKQYPLVFHERFDTRFILIFYWSINESKESLGLDTTLFKCLSGFSVKFYTEWLVGGSGLEPTLVETNRPLIRGRCWATACRLGHLSNQYRSLIFWAQNSNCVSISKLRAEWLNRPKRKKNVYTEITHVLGWISPLLMSVFLFFHSLIRERFTSSSTQFQLK